MSATTLRRALYSKLSTDGTLVGLLAGSTAFYYQVAPQDSQMPYVVFNKLSGTPTYTFGDKAWEDQRWQVKGVTKASTADEVDAIAQRLDQVLTNASLSISGGSLVYLKRESDVDYSEVTDGVRYLHSGGVFRLLYR